MRTVDSSVVIAAFASWHEKHGAARAILDRGVRLVEHCALETYSVLTRLPAPHRAEGGVVRDFLKARFRQPFVRLGATAYREFILTLPEQAMSGGAVYDALVAVTAKSHALTLISCDQRAATTYERYGVRFDLV